MMTKVTSYARIYGDLARWVEAEKGIVEGLGVAIFWRIVGVGVLRIRIMIHCFILFGPGACLGCMCPRGRLVIIASSINWRFSSGFRRQVVITSSIQLEITI
jgi:hypothetical protein